MTYSKPTIGQTVLDCLKDVPRETLDERLARMDRERHIEARERNLEEGFQPVTCEVAYNHLTNYASEGGKLDPTTAKNFIDINLRGRIPNKAIEIHRGVKLAFVVAYATMCAFGLIHLFNLITTSL